jgi:hypothetical protein
MTLSRPEAVGGLTVAAIFSMEPRPPLISSEVDMTLMTLLERMCWRERWAVVAGERRRPRNHGDSRYSYTRDGHVVIAAQGTPDGSGAARLAEKRLFVGIWGRFCTDLAPEDSTPVLRPWRPQDVLLILPMSIGRHRASSSPWATRQRSGCSV